jgi:hypothetical protein
VGTACSDHDGGRALSSPRVGRVQGLHTPPARASGQASRPIVSRETSKIQSLVEIARLRPSRTSNSCCHHLSARRRRDQRAALSSAIASVTRSEEHPVDQDCEHDHLTNVSVPDSESRNRSRGVASASVGNFNHLAHDSSSSAPTTAEPPTISAGSRSAPEALRPCSWKVGSGFMHPQGLVSASGDRRRRQIFDRRPWGSPWREGSGDPFGWIQLDTACTPPRI